MSVEDKIRRAEEIYYKRRMGENSNKNINIWGGRDTQRDMAKEGLKADFGTNLGYRRIGRKSEKNIKLLKKLIKQIIVCLTIYGIFYITVNNNYVFSEDFTNKAKEILNQDIDFKSLYSAGIRKLKEWSELINKKTEENNPIKNDDGNGTGDGVKKNDDINQNNEEGAIGGSSEENAGSSEENVKDWEASAGENTTGNEANNQNELSQMEQDANYIKDTINFIKPINGKITSGFGQRNPTTATVPKNHTGIDIATDTGTKIISATEGTVVLASSTGDYGKHLKIQTSDKNIVVVYAHCNNLYVNEGETIKQGQEIAEVGSTGNATGPHLHFEIRYQERYVNPQLILEL